MLASRCRPGWSPWACRPSPPLEGKSILPNRIDVDWYYDFVSPFAYLQLEQFDRLPAHVHGTLKPVVLGALLSHWGSKGPAEIPEKRRFTYRYAHLRAEELSIAYRMPPAHPFNPIKLLRLAIVLGSTREAVTEIFRFVWREGRAIEGPEDWGDLCARVGGNGENMDARVSSPNVKERLRTMTSEAIAHGIFGVPSFVR